MCAQFILKAKANELSKRFGIVIPEPLEFNIRVHGYMKTELAPVIVAEKDSFVLKEMVFSLCPSWSPQFPAKFTTYNARMERPKMKGKEPVLDKKGKPVHEFIYEVATWKEPFTNAKTCLVPMTAAIESSYFGTHAGNIVQFSHKDSGIFYSIGLWSEWLDKTTGEVKETFTLITDDPYKFFFDTGHDRSVFVVKDSAMEEWLTNKKFTPKERFDFLRSNRTSIDWKVENEREMAKGWQKKAPTEAELSETKVWK